MRINLLNRVRAKPLTAAIDVYLHGRRIRPNGRRCNGKFDVPHPKTQPPHDNPPCLPAVVELAMVRVIYWPGKWVYRRGAMGLNGA